MVKLSVNCAKTGVTTVMRAEKGLHVGYTGLTSKKNLRIKTGSLKQEIRSWDLGEDQKPHKKQGTHWSYLATMLLFNFQIGRFRSTVLKSAKC